MDKYFTLSFLVVNYGDLEGVKLLPCLNPTGEYVVVVQKEVLGPVFA